LYRDRQHADAEDSHGICAKDPAGTTAAGTGHKDSLELTLSIIAVSILKRLPDIRCS